MRDHPQKRDTISIHAPRVGSDKCGHELKTYYCISIHAPRVGSDRLHNPRDSRAAGFQSTLPVWGATGGTQSPTSGREAFQSTLPVWGATHSFNSCSITKLNISIHAPRVGSDPFDREIEIVFFGYFNPRSPCGERQRSIQNIEIINQFQSTLPVWGATTSSTSSSMPISISIHAPRVGSDTLSPSSVAAAPISIHAPRVGSD